MYRFHMEFQAPSCTVQCIRDSGEDLYVFYKDHEDITKWSRSNIAGMQAYSGGISTKQKSSYYSGLNSRNPDAVYGHWQYIVVIKMYTFFFFGEKYVAELFTFI